MSSLSPLFVAAGLGSPLQTAWVGKNALRVTFREGAAKEAEGMEAIVSSMPRVPVAVGGGVGGGGRRRGSFGAALPPSSAQSFRASTLSVGQVRFSPRPGPPAGRAGRSRLRGLPASIAALTRLRLLALNFNRLARVPSLAALAQRLADLVRLAPAPATEGC